MNERYIALLRGINVSGKNLIKMKALTDSFVTMGFGEVITYLQSGNVLFCAHGTTESDLQETITEKIKEEFGLDVPVLVIKPADLVKIRDENPYTKYTEFDEKVLYVTLLKEDFVSSHLDKIERSKYTPDEFEVIENVVYINCPNGYGKTKLTNTFFESKLKVMATTRNWNTINKLIELSGQ